MLTILQHSHGRHMTKKRVLLIMEQCNPDWASVPLVGYRIYQSLAQRADVTLVTHDRNRDALEKKHPNDKIVYMVPSRAESRYYSFLTRVTTFKGRVIWPLFHALYLPIYLYFDKAVAQRFQGAVAKGEYDVVHVITPIQPRFPVALSQLCDTTPFILGPVNGGVPFPDAFKSRGRREFSQLNFIRNIGRILLPGYRRTYTDAALVIAGSTYTRDWVHSTLKVPLERLALIWENGVPDDFYAPARELTEQNHSNTTPLKLIFCGRLEPYKGADMLIKAVAQVRDQGTPCHLSIVGDGSEMAELKKLVDTLKLNEHITFTGWVDQSQTRQFYQEADVFTFPSVREFGGAVVMEAMACSLPCIVIDNGGIAEYVDEESGIRIPPKSEQFVIAEMARHIIAYASNRPMLHNHSVAARRRAELFRWTRKADEIVELYKQLQPAYDTSEEGALLQNSSAK